ncbi:hypothetical protein GUJ93_ZPchr0005g15122 [Zizania palustris]|uniref:Uncharacterized protein n=1 Tax=Zizania palustris TaxID=103762 RepID=A0A8J5SMR0_ZIZPA|nr:hypothetical protein GUJ93_ZPchr0005g15122 [Zizania palustris]
MKQMPMKSFSFFSSFSHGSSSRQLNSSLVKVSMSLKATTKSLEASFVALSANLCLFFFGNFLSLLWCLV